MNAETNNLFMTWLSLFYKNGLWLSWPFFLLGVGLLSFYIVTAVKLGDRNRLHTLPLVAEQTVEFDQAGKAVLCLEGPLLSSRFAGLSYELTGRDGSSVHSRRALARRGGSSFSRARSMNRIFTIPQPGAYVLRTQGLGAPQPKDEDHKLVFMRPHFAQTIGCILGVILGAFLTVGSLVNFFLRLSQGAK